MHKLEPNIIKSQIDLFLRQSLRNYSVSHLDTPKSKARKMLNGSLKRLREEGRKYFLLQNHQNYSEVYIFMSKYLKTSMIAHQFRRRNTGKPQAIWDTLTLLLHLLHQTLCFILTFSRRTTQL